jgi:hypothetical protein
LIVGLRASWNPQNLSYFPQLLSHALQCAKAHVIDLTGSLKIDDSAIEIIEGMRIHSESPTWLFVVQTAAIFCNFSSAVTDCPICRHPPRSRRSFAQ